MYDARVWLLTAVAPRFEVRVYYGILRFPSSITSLARWGDAPKPGSERLKAAAAEVEAAAGEAAGAGAEAFAELLERVLDQVAGVDPVRERLGGVGRDAGVDDEDVALRAIGQLPEGAVAEPGDNDVLEDGGILLAFAPS